jgi:hypothetical protein
MISPGEGSISYHHGGGYGGGACSGVGFHSYNAYAPHGSITGDRTVSHFDRDPFVDTPVVLTRLVYSHQPAPDHMLTILFTDKSSTSSQVGWTSALVGKGSCHGRVCKSYN